MTHGDTILFAVVAGFLACMIGFLAGTIWALIRHGLRGSMTMTGRVHHVSDDPADEWKRK